MRVATSKSPRPVGKGRTAKMIRDRQPRRIPGLDAIRKNAAAFEKAKPELLRSHQGEWVVMQEGEVQGCFPTQDAASDFAYATLSPPFFIHRIADDDAQHVSLI